MECPSIYFGNFFFLWVHGPGIKLGCLAWKIPLYSKVRGRFGGRITERRKDKYLRPSPIFHLLCTLKDGPLQASLNGHPALLTYGWVCQWEVLARDQRVKKSEISIFPGIPVQLTQGQSHSLLSSGKAHCWHPSTLWAFLPSVIVTGNEFHCEGLLTTLSMAIQSVVLEQPNINPPFTNSYSLLRKCLKAGGNKGRRIKE
ncbi:uncharacterized protein LOC143643361 [Tamandua tetradactyla]|uniref:uncharacterized protein LOC143643361 n=1 Tax=Tamandua tetradactyla TaxID=48850 RepID=UPI0040542425